MSEEPRGYCVGRSSLRPARFPGDWPLVTRELLAYIAGMRTRVAVDLVFFTGRKGGTESYAKGLFEALSSATDLEFVGIGARELRGKRPSWFPGEIVTLPISGENRAAWALAVAVALGPQARALRASVLHCPCNFGPAVRLLPTVLTVHDVLNISHPEWVPGGRANAVRLLTRASVRAASRIITVSAASADEIVRLLGRPRSDIDVIHAGVEQPAPDRGERVLSGRPYFLSGGNRMPHKNFSGLLEAWALLPAVERPKLVITGSHGDDPLRPLVEKLGLASDVELREWVTNEQLGELYDGATGYVFPTLFEGFGLPVLEAMARGVPVIASDLPVLHEVGGNCALYVDAREPRLLAEAVLRLLGSESERRALALAGKAQAARFTWTAAAEATANVYRQLTSR